MLIDPMHKIFIGGYADVIVAICEPYDVERPIPNSIIVKFMGPIELGVHRLIVSNKHTVSASINCLKTMA